MAMLYNTGRNTVSIFGIEIGPMEMATTDISAAELSKHLFVRTGVVDVVSSSTTSGSKQKRQTRGEQSQTADA